MIHYEERQAEVNRPQPAVPEVDPVVRRQDELAPIETTLEGEADTVVEVKLQARVSEVGTLELSAVEEGTDRRWRLSFDVRVR